MNKNQNNVSNESLEEDDNMKITTNKSVNFDKINFIKPTKNTEESLKNVVPIRWTDDVLSGNRKESSSFALLPR